MTVLVPLAIHSGTILLMMLLDDLPAHSGERDVLADGGIMINSVSSKWETDDLKSPSRQVMKRSLSSK